MADTPPSPLPPPTPAPPGPPAPTPAPSPPQEQPDAAAWRLKAVSIGGLMALATVLISMAVPVQSGMLYVALRTFGALGAGLFSAGFLGYMDFVNNMIRAGGGFAVFAIVFFFNPPAMVAASAAPAPRAAIVRAIQGSSSAQGAIESARTTDLDAAARRFGYKSFLRMRVTAPLEDLERLRDDLLGGPPTPR